MAGLLGGRWTQHGRISSRSRGGVLSPFCQESIERARWNPECVRFSPMSSSGQSTAFRRRRAICPQGIRSPTSGVGRPKALSKSDLQERLWPGTFVLEKNLANLRVRFVTRSATIRPTRFIGPSTGLATRFVTWSRQGRQPVRAPWRRRLLPAEMVNGFVTPTKARDRLDLMRRSSELCRVAVLRKSRFRQAGDD